MPEEAPKDLWSVVDRYYSAVIIVFSFFFLLGSGVLLARLWRLRERLPLSYTSAEDSAGGAIGEETKAETIKVDISGAVEDPGVYEFLEGSRVEEAIQRAGGLSGMADTAWVRKNLNLAARVSDGQKIYIPKVGEVAGASSSRSGATARRDNCSGKININSAPVERLRCLYNIGNSRAKAIIDYRSKKHFDRIEEIMDVRGIGEKTFERIREQITVD